MRLGIILETNEPEKALNGVRFATTALKQGREVKLFLTSAGVEVERITHEKFNSKKQLDEFVQNKGMVLACGTCIKARNQKESEACPISTMVDCVTSPSHERKRCPQNAGCMEIKQAVEQMFDGVALKCRTLGLTSHDFG